MPAPIAGGRKPGGPAAPGDATAASTDRAIAGAVADARKPMSFRAEIAATLGFIERNFYLVKRYFGWELVFLFYNSTP